jgi:hypothetical protein
MKKKILVTAIVAVLAFQSAWAQEIAIGVKAGLNFANVNTTSAAAAYNSRTGYHAGAYVMFKFSKIALQPELIFSQQGSSVSFNSQNFDSNFSYINIPIMLKLYLIGGLNLQAGPQFGFLTSAKSEVPDGLGGKITQDTKDTLKGSDISIGMGAGWDFPFGLNIGARYNLGVSDNNNSSSSSTVKNQVFQVSAGFRIFKLGN